MLKLEDNLDETRDEVEQSGANYIASEAGLARRAL